VLRLNHIYPSLMKFCARPKSSTHPPSPFTSTWPPAKEHNSRYTSQQVFMRCFVSSRNPGSSERERTILYLYDCNSSWGQVTAWPGLPLRWIYIYTVYISVCFPSRFEVFILLFFGENRKLNFLCFW
jgi:hypothetical protein